MIVARRPSRATACNAVAAPPRTAFTAARDAASAWRCVSDAGRPVGIVVVEDETRAVAADARRTRGACGRDDCRSSRGRELNDKSAGHSAGAVHEDPLACRDRCGLLERLVGGERGHREGGGRLPRDDRRLARNKYGRSDEPLRPRALVSQRQWVGEHLVARCEPCHVFADRVDDSRRFDAERQRWPAPDVPAPDPDDLVPVTNTSRSHRDHDLVRRGDDGAKRSSMRTTSPNASMPAARICRMTTTSRC